MAALIYELNCQDQPAPIGGVKVSSRERTEEKVEVLDRGFSGNHTIGRESSEGSVAAV